MPIYTYKCRECGHQFDKMQKVSEKLIPECEACGSETRRVFHPVGIIFKGSGFYKTDNRSEKSKTESPAKKDEKESKKEDKKESKKEDNSGPKKKKEVKKEVV